MGKKSFEELWAPMIRLARHSAEKKPAGEGWLTLQEFRKKAKCGKCKARRIILDGIKRGAIERFRGTQLNASKRAGQQNWYRPKTA